MFRENDTHPLYDENATDAFSVKHYFSNNKSRIFKDLTNVCDESFYNFQNVSGSSRNKRKPADNHLSDSKRLRLDYKTHTKNSSCAVLEHDAEKIDVDDSFDSFISDKLHLQEIDLNDHDQSMVSISDDIDTDYDYSSELERSFSVIDALIIPDNQYSDNHHNNFSVCEPDNATIMVKVPIKTVSYQKIMSSAKIDQNVYTVPLRKHCSPRSEYSLSNTNQYISQDLLEAHVKNKASDSIFDVDYVRQLSSKTSFAPTYAKEFFHTTHFYNRSLEKLECSTLSDFLPRHESITGSILGGFINDLFTLFNQCNLNSELIHHAVDIMYLYLNSLDNVSVVDLKFITSAALFIAAKYSSVRLDISQSICDFSGLSVAEIFHAELRLLTVIDINISRPHAIHYRNTYMKMAKNGSPDPGSNITEILQDVHIISGFVLDMICHCYNFMLLPPSLRAAAALWVARAVTFLQPVSDPEQNEEADEAMALGSLEPVWPARLAALSGYSLSDVTHLAVSMHIVVLALLQRGHQNNPLVDGVYNKYNCERMMSLTGRYERLSAKRICRAAMLFCRSQAIPLSEWLAHNKLQSMLLSASSCQTALPYRRVHSVAEMPNTLALTGRPSLVKHTESSNPAVSNSSCSSMASHDSGYMSTF